MLDVLNHFASVLYKNKFFQDNNIDDESGFFLGLKQIVKGYYLTVL